MPVVLGTSIAYVGLQTWQQAGPVNEAPDIIDVGFACRRLHDMQVRRRAVKVAKSVAQRRLAVLDLKRATAIGVVMQRMRYVALQPTPCMPVD